ncbi:MAG: RsiV family protein [Treponema sp.]|jgi:hypothetical protein|nr:RsiV family protein [Treponema sp.]
MKKINRRQGFGPLSLLWFLGSLLIPGCAGTPKPDASPVKAPRFLSHTEQRILPLYPDQAEKSPRMTLNITILEGSGSQGQFIQDFLYDGLSPQAYTERLITQYADQYFAMKNDPALFDEHRDQFLESLNWEYAETWEAGSPWPQVLVISRNLEYYLGGAHGMREKHYFVILQDTHRMQALTPADLIEPDSWSRLEELVVQALRIEANLEPDEPLSQGGFFQDEVEIPDNFFLTPQGLGFHWNPYEIAPYVMGSMEVLLPYEQIQDMLKPAIPIDF